MASAWKPRLKGRVLLAFLAAELGVFVWMRAYLFGTSRRIAVREPDSIAFVLYHDKVLFHSKCCLNNLLMAVISGQIQQGCDLAKQTNMTAAVLLPRDLDRGGALRMSSNTPFSMFTSKSIDDLKRLARDKLDCLVVSEDEIDGAGIPKVHYDRPSDRSMMMHGRGPLHEWTYRNMRLPSSLLPVFDVCYKNATRHQRFLAVHMRIESDWYPYCAKRSYRKDGVSACYKPTQIAKSVSALDYDSAVLIYGNVHRIYRNESPADVWKKVNPHQRSFHKSWSDDCATDLRNLTYNQIALLDFWISIEADAFVGTHLSTFSNMISYVRDIRGRRNSSYVYSCPDSPLMLRHDGGLLTYNTSDRQRCYPFSKVGENVLVETD